MTGGDGTDRREQLGNSVFSVLNTLLRRWRLVLGTPMALVLGVLFISMLTGAEYEAQTTLMPRTSEGGASRITGLAAQLGLDVSGPSGETPEFYAELLKTPGLLREAAASNYRVAVGPPEERDTIEGTLVDLYDIEVDRPENALRATAAHLRKNVSARAELTTGLVTLTVSAPWPELAVAVTDRMIELINEFNLERRQTQARAEREFVGRRLDDIRGELAQAEDSLAAFYVSNRSIGNSPWLQVQADRLQRNVERLQQLYISLAQSYEQARIEEVRDIPVLTVVVDPAHTVREAGVSLPLLIAVAMLIGGALGLGVAFLVEATDPKRMQDDVAYFEFRERWRGIVKKIRVTFKGALRSSR